MLGFVASLLLGKQLLGQELAKNLRDSQKKYLEQIVPILKENCGDCHWGEGADAGLDLKPFKDVGQILEERTEWQKVLKRVAKKQMPPEDYGSMAESQRSELLRWLDQLVNQLDCTETQPGRVTIRRLNRTEYQNTIRDLTLVNFRPASEFPGDDVGYGFDNIGDVLSLPPILMEKYLDAAERILDEAIVDPRTLSTDRTLFGSEFDEVRGSRHVGDDHAMTTNGTLTRRFDFPTPGKYQVTVEAYGDHAGDDWPELQINLQGIGSQRAEVQSRKKRPSLHHFDFQVDDAGTKSVSVSFLNDYYDPDFPLRSARDRNLYVGFVKVKGPSGKKTKLAASHRKIVSAVPGKNLTIDQAAEKVIRRFLIRAFRRNVTHEEVARIKSLFDLAMREEESYELSLRFALQAVLVSPHFLYKVELPPPADGQPHDLGPFELATSLSYFLWSSMPDDELLRAASNGDLQNPKLYREQIQRMLSSPKASALIENFAEQWLQLRVLQQLQPDPEMFPDCDEQLLADMATETKMVFADLMKRDGRVFELLNSEFSFLNPRLAEHYGIDGVTGEGFRRVRLPTSKRVGILTHASVLTLTSNPNRTSPVKRGKWIMENLLGEEPPPALPDAAPLEKQDALGGTLRERMEQHRKDPNCASCHQKMDQLGFALENYDAVGQWRETDAGEPIDSSAKLPDGLRFDGAIELQRALETELQKQFLTCMSEKLLIFALGRGLRYTDQCAVEEILKQAKQSDYQISELIIAVAESEPFLKRSRRSTQE